MDWTTRKKLKTYSGVSSPGHPLPALRFAMHSVDHTRIACGHAQVPFRLSMPWMVMMKETRR